MLLRGEIVTKENKDVVFRVRSGIGTVSDDGSFTDVVATEVRTLRQHSGWQSVAYKGNRYRLGGGIRTDFYICLNNPIKKR